MGDGGGRDIGYVMKYVLCLKTQTAGDPGPDVSQTPIEFPRQGREESFGKFSFQNGNPYEILIFITNLRQYR